MAITTLTAKTWQGLTTERFTYEDMNRVLSNANSLAVSVGVTPVQFLHFTQSSQFRYDEVNKLEYLLYSCIVKMRSQISRPTDAFKLLMLMTKLDWAWAQGHVINYSQIERWENTIWQIYTMLGGTGSRIPWNGSVPSVSRSVLKADGWIWDNDTSEYYQDIYVSEYTENATLHFDVMDALTYTSAFNAHLRTVDNGDHYRVYADSLKPGKDIPIIIKNGEYPMYQNITLTSAGWSNSAPYTQTVTLGQAITNGILGPDNRNSPAQMLEYSKGVLCLTSLNGTQAVVTALGDKPISNLYATVVGE